MTRARRAPRPRWWVPSAAVAVVTAALLVDTSSGPDPTGRRPGAAVAEPGPTRAPRAATVEEFCGAFAYLAASYTDQLANPDRDSAAPLEAAAAELRSIGRPPGMSDLHAAGLALLVDDILQPFRHLATRGAAPAPGASRGAEEELALERVHAYVEATCAPT